MKRAGGGYDYGYNAHTAVDETAQIVEAPNGWIKNVLGFRQFSLRGLETVGAEFKLVCLALN